MKHEGNDFLITEGFNKFFVIFTNTEFCFMSVQQVFLKFPG